MRDAILARVRPLVERFANELADLATARIEHELERLQESIAVALSAYASDAEADILTGALGPELAQMLEVARPVRTAAQPEAVVRPAVVPPRAETVDGKSPTHKRKPNSCSKCGALGFTAQSCGKTHNVAKPKSDRVASIAASAQKIVPRRAAPEEDNDVVEHWSSKRIAEERELAENSKHEGELPRPQSSFRVTPPRLHGEGGEIEELDFGGAGSG